VKPNFSISPGTHPKKPKLLKHISVWLFFLLLLLLGISRYRDYGISWDETKQRLTGAVTLKYLAESFHVPASRVHWDERLPSLAKYQDRDYGVAFEAPAFALEQLLRLKDLRDVYMFRHLLTFLVFLGGVFAVYRLSLRRFSDWRIGLLSALFLVLTPRFFAESFYNSKDIVFMAVFAVAMNTMIVFVLRPRVTTAFIHALGTAVAIDVRIMALFLMVASVALLMIRLIRRELPMGKTFLVLALYIVGTCTFVVVMWPYLWSRPLGHFVLAFKNMAHFRWGGELRYMGAFIQSNALPWHYTFTWIGITTPLFYLVLFVIGVFVTSRQIAIRGTKLWQSDAELQDIVFLVLFFGPIASVISFHSVVYNGWRQLYFIYPAFLLLAAKGWVAVWSTEPTWNRYKISLLVLTAFSVVCTAMWMWKAHPLENVYFNVLAGKNVRARYEMDYWGLGNRKALEYILEHDNSPVITVWADSVTPLAKSVIMLKPEDRRRISIQEDSGRSSYVLTNYYGVKETDNAKFGREYKLFYELKAGDEVVLSVFKWQGETIAEDSPDWSGSLTTAKGPGNFAPPPPMRLAYRFGWVGVQAAKAEIQLISQTPTTFEIDATGATSGMARALFKLDLYQQAIENKMTLRPIHLFQEEKYRSATVRTSVDFESNQLTGLRQKIPDNYPDMPKIFTFSPVFDMASALLWVRSQPLAEGETESIVVWASNAPYLATVTVLGRDTIRVNGHEDRAIKLDLKLNGIDNKMHLKECKLFKDGRAWLSDDAKRIPLRIEADIFIGYVFAELESVQSE
jgi:Protein of unknown function (DUF3108)